MQDFVDTNPMNIIVKDMLHKYEGQTEEVLALPQRHIIGSIQINMGICLLFGYSLNNCIFSFFLF